MAMRAMVRCAHIGKGGLVSIDEEEVFDSYDEANAHARGWVQDNPYGRARVTVCNDAGSVMLEYVYLSFDGEILCKRMGLWDSTFAAL